MEEFDTEWRKAENRISSRTVTASSYHSFGRRSWITIMWRNGLKRIYGTIDQPELYNALALFVVDFLFCFVLFFLHFPSVFYWLLFVSIGFCSIEYFIDLVITYNVLHGLNCRCAITQIEDDCQGPRAADDVFPRPQALLASIRRLRRHRLVVPPMGTRSLPRPDIVSQPRCR